MPFPSTTLGHFFQLYVNITSSYGILGILLSLNCTLIQLSNMQLLLQVIEMYLLSQKDCNSDLSVSN